LISSVTKTAEGDQRTLKSILGNLPIRSRQAEILGVGKGKQLSPYLAQCCLRSSANVSDADAAKDVAMMTGISVSAKTQQRLVQGYELPEPIAPVEHPMRALCVDGGKVRLRTPLGELSSWRDYKAIETNVGIVAHCRNHAELIEWVNHQPFAPIVSCLGDGQDGVWKSVAEIATPAQRREILDWYHRIEKLHQIGGSNKRLQQAQTL